MGSSKEMVGIKINECVAKCINLAHLIHILWLLNVTSLINFSFVIQQTLRLCSLIVLFNFNEPPTFYATFTNPLPLCSQSSMHTKDFLLSLMTPHSRRSYFLYYFPLPSIISKFGVLRVYAFTPNLLSSLLHNIFLIQCDSIFRYTCQ
jgi:hypothetical protein